MDVQKLERIFAESLKYSNRITPQSEQASILGNVEKDAEFVKAILGVSEYNKNLSKSMFTDKINLSDDQYSFVEKVGQKHYQANIFNQTSFKDIKQLNKEIRCPCGCKRAYGQSLPYCIDEQEQAFFGPGIILFFFYTKRIFFAVLGCVLIYGLFSLVTNATSSNTNYTCNDIPFFDSMFCEWKLIAGIQNKQTSPYLILQLCLGFVMCLFWSIGVRFIKAWGRKKNKQIDEKLDSASDHYIFMERLPRAQYNEYDILKYLEELWNQTDHAKDTELKIKGVQIIYDMSEPRKMIASILKMAEQIAQCVQEQKNSAQYLIKDELAQVYKEKKKLIHQEQEKLREFRSKFILDKEFRRKLSTEYALVEFGVVRQMDIFLYHFGRHRRTILKDIIEQLRNYLFTVTNSLLFKGNNIRISKAPEPSDILWTNCEKQSTHKNTIIVWLLTFLLNGLSFGVLELVREIRRNNPSLEWLSLVSIILINLFNRLIWNILLKIALLEDNQTKTINIISVMNKSYVSQLINIIFIPIIIKVVQDNDIDSPTGLAAQTHDFQLTSLIFMTLFNLINVPHRLVMLIQCVPCLRRLAIKYYCKVSGQFNTYEEMKDALTFLYEPPLVPVAGIYVYITNIIGQAFFFCHLQPVILFYLLGNLIFFHLINRYLILKMCKIPDMLDILVYETCLGYAQNIPALYGVSSILFMAIRNDDTSFAYYIPSIMCLILWFISVENPFGLYRRLTECMVSTFIKEKLVVVPDQQMNEQNQEESSDEISISIMRMLADLAQRGHQKREENYYASVGTNDLFNYENKLNKVKGEFHNKNKQFCESFTMGYMQEMISIEVPSSEDD